MPRPISPATLRALDLVREGAKPFAAARESGISANTIYVALARQRQTPNTQGIPEAAKRLGLSRQRVHQLCTQQRVEGASQIGRRWAIPVAGKILPPLPPRAPRASKKE